MTYFTKYDYTIIRKHWIHLLFKYLKSFFYLLFAFILYFISIKYKSIFWGEVLYLIIIPTIFILVNYAFITLILWYIKFFNDILIVHNWQLIVIKTSLLIKDDIEFIDLNKITKLDIFCRWIIPNILWYGVLVVEQQRDSVREFHLTPKPYLALDIIKKEKEKYIDENKTRYIVDNPADNNL